MRTSSMTNCRQLQCFQNFTAKQIYRARKPPKPGRFSAAVNRVLGAKRGRPLVTALYLVARGIAEDGLAAIAYLGKGPFWNVDLRRPARLFAQVASNAGLGQCLRPSYLKT